MGVTRIVVLNKAVITKVNDKDYDETFIVRESLYSIDEFRSIGVRDIVRMFDKNVPV